MNQTGLWFALVAVALLLARREWLVAHKPAHPKEIADELATVCQYPFTMFPNHAGTRMVFKGLDETGTGIYLGEMANGKKKMVCHQDEVGWTWQAFIMLGWSPDDHYFACAFPPRDPKLPHEEILICDGTTGEILFKLTADWKIAELAWLSPNSFAYSYSDSGSFDVAVIEQKSAQEWVQSTIFKKMNMPVMTGLTAMSPSSVAWKQGNNLWSLDFVSGVPQKIWETATNQLVAFAFSAENKEFLLNCTDEHGWFLLRYSPATKWIGDAGRTSDQINYPVQALWFNQGTRYAYLNHENGLNVFYIKANNTTNLIRLPWQGEVSNFTLDGNHLYASGYLTNGVLGIWQYDFNLANVNCVIPSSKRHLQYSSIVAPDGEVFTNAVGEQKTCYLWPPAHVARDKKYPVVLSQAIFRGGPYSETTANENFYFALADRPSWFVGLYNWRQDIMEAYGQLTNNPNIDANRIFISATSAETAYLCQLLKDQPNLCRGVILISPTTLPDLENCNLSSIFIVSGTSVEDSGAPKRLGEYQNRAAEMGIDVKLFFVEGAGHNTLRSIGGIRGQLQQYAEFLSEN